MTLTHNGNFWYFDALLSKKNITSMSGMLFLMFVQRMFKFEAKEGEMKGILQGKNYLDMSFMLPMIFFLIDKIFSAISLLEKLIIAKI